MEAGEIAFWVSELDALEARRAEALKAARER
jgi:hypothetical protein